MNKPHKDKKSFSALNIILIVQLILMLILSMGITQIMSQSTTESSVKYMTIIAEERSQIILNFIDNAEKTLSEYSHAGEIYNVLNNPGNQQAIRDAQAYTSSFADDIVNLEGLYVSDWNTRTLAHSQKKVLTTRSGGQLKELQDSLKASGESVYNAGIINSPASGKQIISMYKAVYGDDGEPIGLVGLGIFTDGLADILDSLSKRDMEKSFYSMVNVSDKKYLFNSDSRKISSEADNSILRKECEKLSEETENVTGYFNYTADGKKYISIYSYMPENGWMFMIDDLESEILSLTRSMRLYLVLFCVFCVVLIIIFNIIIKKQEDAVIKLADEMAVSKRTRESLNTAVFSDILTDTKNRVSFLNDFESGKKTAPSDYPYYFAMFSIAGLSNINIMYGEGTGDLVLTTTSRILKQVFEKGTVYRTGSDEFVVAAVMPKTTVGYNRFMHNVDGAFSRLMQPYDTSKGPVSVPYGVVAARKSGDVDASVLSVMKNIINQNGPAMPGHISFTDLDLVRKNKKKI